LLISRRLGIQDVDQAGDSDALICALSANPPDMLVLDWRLIGAPVLETCRLLSRAYPCLQIILLSMDPGDYRSACSVGAKFIHKGAKPEDVITTLQEVLNLNNMEAEKNTDDDPAIRV